MTDFNQDSGNIVEAMIKNGIGLTVMIFKAIFSFGYMSAGFIVSIFSIIITLAPFILSILFLFVTHPYLIFILVECWILIRFIIFDNPVDKVAYFVEWHVKIFKFLTALPSELMNIQEKIMITYITMLTTIKNTADTVYKIVDWIVSIGNSFNIAGIPLGAAVIGIAFITLLVGFFSYFASF